MSISVLCENCGHRFRARDEHAGKKAQCPKCGDQIVIPDGEAEDSEEFEIVTTEPPAEARPPVLPPSLTTPSGRGAGQGGWFGGVGTGMLGLGRQSGLLCLVVGLVFVVTARGCESLATRSALAATVRLQKKQSEFSDEWNDKRGELERKLSELEEKRIEANDPQMGEAIREEIAETQKKLRDSRRDEAKARAEKERGDWDDLEQRSRDARTDLVLGQFWRELLFVFGSLVLVVGLVTVGFTGTGHERRICLIMIAIITFSVYVGGMAWLDSAINAASSSARILR